MFSVYELPSSNVQRKATTLYALRIARGMCRTEKRPFEGSVPASASVLRVRLFDSLLAIQAPWWNIATRKMKHATKYQTSFGYALFLWDAIALSGEEAAKLFPVL